MPIILGGTPSTANDFHTPNIGKFRFIASSLLMSNTAAAPSVNWEEFPAVVDPFFLKTGFNLESLSAV